jgi:uncharacterized oxidoreductase
MQETGNTVVITGGSSGIGLAAAEVLAAAGNDVIVCGRNEERLRTVKERLPQLHTLVCDVSDRAERVEFFSRVTREFPGVNVLINNAGIQRETDFLAGAPELTDGESEIDTNFTAAVHLSPLFIPHFVASDRPCAVVNVTSGLAFIPLKSVPVYCATKAALHSFSMSLRSQLEGTHVRVFEIIPPMVKTDLHRSEEARRQSEKRGISAKRVADALLNALKKDRYEASIGEGGDLKWASRIAPHFFHRMLNKLESK